MLRPHTRIILIIAAAGFLTLGASWVESYRDARSAVAAAEAMQGSLEQLRDEVSACLDIREQAELRFQDLDRDTRVLRAQVDSFEALDPRGVPAAEYEDYLDRVEDFNASTEAWERESENLQRFASECDSLVTAHNEGVTELRGFLIDEGVWEEGWLEEGLAP